MEDLTAKIMPITVGLVEGLKMHTNLKGKYYFFASILIALTLSIMLRKLTPEAIILGLIEGLASAGVYSGLKSIFE